MIGRHLSIYLVDGSSRGVLTAEILNWTGKVVVSARTQLADLASREEVKRTGIYALVGEDPDNPRDEQVYIGESDNVLQRLIEHNRDSSKEFWIRTIIVTSKDSNLTKAHCRYLEARLIQQSLQSRRAKVVNGTNPELPPLPEPDTSDMEYFLDQVQLLLPVLGFSFALPVPTTVAQTSVRKAGSPKFEITERGVRAYAQEIGDEFVVLKGSTARKDSVPSAMDSDKQTRAELLNEGKLTESSDQFWQFTQDVPFSSPSAAANAVTGGKYNGRIKWRVQTSDKTYADWQNEQIELATQSKPPDE